MPKAAQSLSPRNTAWETPETHPSPCRDRHTPRPAPGRGSAAHPQDEGRESGPEKGSQRERIGSESGKESAGGKASRIGRRRRFGRRKRNPAAKENYKILLQVIYCQGISGARFKLRLWQREQQSGNRLWISAARL